MVLSPKEAIVHLAQVQERTRTGADEVSNLALGFGQGVSNRSRAVEGLDLKVQDAGESLDSIRHDLSAHRSVRARSRWHWVLENITSGRLGLGTTDSRYASTWRWRYALSASNLHVTGWRPTEQFREKLAANRGFFWAQKNAYRLNNIPKEINVKLLKEALGRVLVDHGGFHSLELACEVFVLTEISSFGSTWSAGVYFPNDIHFKLMERQLSDPFGIFVTNEQTPLVENLVLMAKQHFDSALVLFNVNPSEKNRKRKKEAKRDYEMAKTGLRIVRDDKHGNIEISPPFEKRETPSAKSSTVVHAMRQDIEDYNAKIAALVTKEDAQKKRFDKLSGLFNGNGQVASTFEALQALDVGESEKTNCCICLDSLGASAHSDSFGSARVSMTKCGHL